jgi:hypothetical protein
VAEESRYHFSHVWLDRDSAEGDLMELNGWPECGPCDSAAIYIAAAAGRTIVRAGTGNLLTSPYQVQALLINALLKGGQVPALIAARDHPRVVPSPGRRRDRELG